MQQLKKCSAPAIALYLFCVFLLPGHANGEKIQWEEVYRTIYMKFPSVPLISSRQLHFWMTEQQENRPLLLDARSPEEYAVSHLRGAYLAQTVEEALPLIDKFGTDRPIVTYCSVGYRSAALAKKLLEKGYHRVYNLEGSIFQWANEGRELYQGDKRVFFVHPYDEEWGQLLDRQYWYKRQ
jgi:rhodanese-related sulfurtransferase